MSVLQQCVAQVTVTAVGAPGVDTCVVAQLALVQLTLIHIRLLLHRVLSLVSSPDREGLLGELAVRDWHRETDRMLIKAGLYSYLIKMTRTQDTTSVMLPLAAVPGPPLSTTLSIRPVHHVISHS